MTANLNQAKKAYSEKLKDPRWQKKRLEVLEFYGWECSLCGDTESMLHVHHRDYFKGREPWEYEVSQLEVLCKTCHSEGHSDGIEDDLRVVCSKIPSRDDFGRWDAASLLSGYCDIDNEDFGRNPYAYLLGVMCREISKSSTRIGFLVDVIEQLKEHGKTNRLSGITLELKDPRGEF